MGVIHLKWRDAMAVAGWHFIRVEHDAGWPDSMKPDQLAALQRPYIRGGPEHRPGRWQTEALMKAISDACKGDTLAHDVTVTQSQKFVTGGRISFVRSWEGGSHRVDPPKTQPAKEVTVHHIDAPAFAAWLAAQDKTPSVHVQAWFDAVGIAGAQSDTSDTDSVRWTDERKAEARAMVDQLRAAGTRAFKAETAKHYGVSVTRLSAVLKDDNAKPVKSSAGVNSVFALAGRKHRIQ